MAQGAAPKEIAKSKLRHLLARNKSLNCTDVRVRGSVTFHKLVGREVSRSGAARP